MPLTEHVDTWTKLDAIHEALIASNDRANLRMLLWDPRIKAD